MKKVFLSLFIVDVFFVLFIYFFKNEAWLINSQIAFLSSSLIMFASIFSYRGMVRNGLSAGAIPDDERDTLDILEDPYDLYDDEKKSKEEEKTLEEVVKEERDKLKTSGRSIWETTKDVKTSFSFYRLGAYSILVLGFFYLNSNQLLELIPYLISLSIPPIVIVIALMRSNS